jgi:peptidoglycan/LPS O-acetylase OafA/YrhL
MSDDEGAAGRTAEPGDVIVAADAIGTAVFVLTAVIAAASFSTAAQWVGAITAMSLFVIGVAAFLWAFYNAVQRSRTEQVSVTQLFLLLGDAVPARIRRIMLGLVAVQFLTALLTTLARPDGPDGSPGSSLAVGFLVVMFGLGLNGLWAAYHGTFSPRDDFGDITGGAAVNESARRRDKNEDHG